MKKSTDGQIMTFYWGRPLRFAMAISVMVKFLNLLTAT